jgi:long-chain acyl-CoA synthetase
MTDIPRTTLVRIFLESVDRFGDADAFGRITPALQVEMFSYRATLEMVRRVSAALEARGIQRGDRVAILSENRLEWALADFGAICAGVVDVPVYPSLKPDQIAYILNDCGARVVFVPNRDSMAKVVEARGGKVGAYEIVVFDPPAELPEGVVSWDAFLAAGDEIAARKGEEGFRREALRAEPDDVATILYTSGTTGDPKGVMLTHRNLSANVLQLAMVLKLTPEDVTLSFLPLSHIFQRMVDYFFLGNGCTVVHGRSIATASEDMKIVRPTVVGAVPRLYEKMYMAMTQARGFKKKLMSWAMSVAERSADVKLAGGRPTGLLALQDRLADRLVFSKIRAIVGGRVRWFVSGSAPLAASLNRFFYSVGLTILEGYGLTETSPVLSINTESHLRVGTVGRLLPGTELKIASDGEILVRGPQVMKGYYNLPDETAKSIDAERWFSTGDIGELDAEGYLKITDRKKDLLKTSGGKYIAPAVIENRLKQVAIVEQSVVIGNNRKFVALLVLPSLKGIETVATDRGISWKSHADLIRNEQIRKHVDGEVRKHFQGLASYETPKKVALIEGEFTVENGLLTPSLKVKRKMVNERYADVIESLYSGDSGGAGE